MPRKPKRLSPRERQAQIDRNAIASFHAVTPPESPLARARFLQLQAEDKTAELIREYARAGESFARIAEAQVCAPRCTHASCAMAYQIANAIREHAKAFGR